MPEVEASAPVHRPPPLRVTSALREQLATISAMSSTRFPVRRMRRSELRATDQLVLCSIQHGPFIIHRIPRHCAANLIADSPK